MVVSLSHEGGAVECASTNSAVVCESLLFAEEKVGVRTNQYKYVRWDNGKEELYDLTKDPHELLDIATTQDIRWARSLVDRTQRRPATDEATAMSEERATRIALRGLSYIS